MAALRRVALRALRLRGGSVDARNRPRAAARRAKVVARGSPCQAPHSTGGVGEKGGPGPPSQKSAWGASALVLLRPGNATFAWHWPSETTVLLAGTPWLRCSKPGLLSSGSGSVSSRVGVHRRTLQHGQTWEDFAMPCSNALAPAVSSVRLGRPAGTPGQDELRPVETRQTLPVLLSCLGGSKRGPRGKAAQPTGNRRNLSHKGSWHARDG